MHLLLSCSLVVVAIAFFFTAFIKVAMYECKAVTIESQSGKTFIVTGANSGIGYFTSLALAKAGGTVIMACRNLKNCEEAKKTIIKTIEMQPNATKDFSIDVQLLDLASFKSIKSFANNIRKKYDKKIDCLINNAGIMAIPERKVTLENIELQMGTNHMGHFLLTGLLLSSLKKQGRIINHSSAAHMLAAHNFTFNDLQSEIHYDKFWAYANSKLANLLFTFELNILTYLLIIFYNNIIKP